MELFEVQKEALRRSNRAEGFAYFMEQGLGKTLTSYADFQDLLSDRLATRMMVVCPNSFKKGWVKDAEKHGLDYDFFVWNAGMLGYFKTWLKKKFTKPPVFIVNWEAIRIGKKKVGKKMVYYATELMEAIMEFVGIVNGRALVVFDESIQAKTHDSAQTMGGIWLSEHFNYSRILSGKPIVQGPHDLWGQFRLIKQFRNRNFYAFKTAFCKMGGFKAKQVVGAQNEDILSSLIDPHSFNATKKDWTDLPPKLPGVIKEYTLTPEMASMYKSMEEEFVLWLEDDEHVAVDAAITKYIKLAQIQCGWIYDEDGNVRWLVEDSKNPRLNLLKQLLDEEITGKVLIPYHHKPVFDQLMRAFGGEEKCAYITGGMDPDAIEEQKRRFNEDPEILYMFLQTRASKYGHTLLGIQSIYELACRTMIFYENTYSLDDRSQIEDRPHRHGQNYAVSYIDLVGTPLDYDCVEALQRKEGVFQSVFAPLREKQKKR